MEIKQLNNYKIEFYSEEEWKDYPYNIMLEVRKFEGLYTGFVSDINEELAGKIIEPHEKRYNDLTKKWESITYKNYKDNSSWTCTAKESFQTLSELPYCIIKPISE